MFKNALVFRFGPAWTPDLALLEGMLQTKTFEACGPTQLRSVGWIPPRGQDNGALVESVGGQWMLKMMQETKSVPSSVVGRLVDERCEQITVATGRKPGKKERKELKENAVLELLPHAFPARSAIQLWIDPEARLLMIDASSLAKADGVLTFLAASMEAPGLSFVQTTWSPVAAMSEWLLSQEPPAGFSIDRECELKANDDSKALVRYAKHPLDIAEVQQHIRHGKVPTKLAMTWEGRVSFVLTDKAQITKLAFLEGVYEGAGSESKDDRFDADVAIATGEFKKMIPAILEALGGEMAPIKAQGEEHV